MRHGKKVNHLSRTVTHRRALLANLAINIIEHKRIVTTLAKAKALRQYVEPLVTKAVHAAQMEKAIDAVHQRRTVFSLLQNKEAIKELFGPIAAKVGDRPGGYLRIIKTGFRRGDGAETAMIEFVDYNEIYTGSTEKTENKKKTRRSARKKSATPAVAAAPVVAAAEKAVEDVVNDVNEETKED